MARLLRMVILFFALSPVASASDYVIVVNEANKVKDYKSADLAKVFKHEVRHWGDKSTIKVLMPKNGTDEFSVLLDKVFSMSEQDLAKYWVGLIYQNKIAARPKSLPPGKVLLKVVALDAAAISIAKAEDAKGAKGIKVLTIDGKKPGDEGYPLTDKKKGGAATIEAAGSSGEAVEASSGAEPTSQGMDDETAARMAELEDALLDVQVELAGGGADSDFDPSEGPSIEVRGFSHVTAGIQDNDPSGGTSFRDNQFAMGGLDLFITSQLAKNVSFLNETVFEPTEEGDYVLDVERVIFKYEISDSLNIQAGRFHTTLGYWNEYYHHGEYLQTSVGRPGIVNFEDEDGLLPVHLVGLVMKGRQDTEALGIDYTLEIGNGRGATPDPPQIAIDANDQKAVNLAFGLSPSAVQGWRFGGNIYFDKISANSSTSAGSVHGVMDELIWGLFSAYRHGSWEVLAEFFSITHDETGFAKTDSTGWYAQFARSFGDWSPFLRYDSAKLDDQDRFYASVDDTDTLALGVRWDFAPWSALKLQYENRDITLAAGGSDTVDALLLQLAYAF